MDWNLKNLYKDLSDPQIDIDIDKSKEAVGSFVEKWSSDMSYLEDPEKMYEAIEELNTLDTNSGICTKPGYYIFLQRSIDQSNPDIKARENKLNNIAVELENKIQFFEISISKIPEEKQKIFLEHPKLVEYRHFLSTLFKSGKYTLSDKEEAIFNIKSKTSHSNWVDMVEELLSKQKLKVLDEDLNKKEIVYNEVGKYLFSKNKKVRDFCAKEFLKINNRYSEIAEFEINSILENKSISDKYRGIDRPDLPRILHDDIDTDIVDTLISVVSDNLDIPNEYYKLKASMLSQDKLEYYERSVPLVESNKEYSFGESFEIVRKKFKELDPEFEKIVVGYKNNQQYDVYPKEGKSGGAFCAHEGKNLPTYILLNHKNKLEDVLTLAHESGHGIHSEYSKEQKALNTQYSTATAEVASTFFEDLVLEELSKDFSEKEKKEIAFKRIEDSISTIFRQVALYNFEVRLHNEFRDKGFLSKNDISNIFTNEMHRYMGDSVSIDKHMELGWVNWSHIRMFFYVYSYASGLLISKALQEYVREDPKFIENVKIFFKAGGSKSPRDIFLDMGIDISKREFWEKGIENIRREFDIIKE